MRRILAVALVVAVLAVLPALNTGYGQALVVVEKEVCFDISVYDPVSNETVSKTLCIKLQILAEPGNTNSSIVVSFPVEVHLYNKTVTKTVAVPLDISGRVVAIYVKGSAPSTADTDIIWATFPSPSPTAIVTATPTATITATTQPATPAAATSAATPSPSPRPTQQLVYTYTYSPMLPPPPPPTIPSTSPAQPSQPGLDTATASVIIAVGGVAAAVLIAWRMSRKPRPKAPPPTPQPAAVDVLASRTIAELQRQLEEERQRRELAEKSINIKLKCSKCGVYVSPVRLDDGTLLCPQCNSVIARINEAGGLELAPEERPEKAEKPKAKRSEPKVEHGEEEG